MDQQIIFVALSAGLTTALALIGAAQLMRSPRIELRDRIAAYSEAAPYAAANLGMLRDRRASRFFLFDAWLQRRDWTEKTQLKLERAGLRLRVGEYVLLRGFVATAGGLVGVAAPIQFGVAAIAPLTLVVGALIGVVIPPLFLRVKINRRSEKIEAQLVEMCELMASMLTSGFGYLQTLSSPPSSSSRHSPTSSGAWSTRSASAATRTKRSRR